MRKSRVDSNQKEIVEALRAIGCSVHCTHMVRDGFPDIIVGTCTGLKQFPRLNLMLEIKDGSLPPSRQRLSVDEIDFHSKWNGQIQVVNSVEKALAVVNYVRRLV